MTDRRNTEILAAIDDALSGYETQRSTEIAAGGALDGCRICGDASAAAGDLCEVCRTDRGDSQVTAFMDRLDPEEMFLRDGYALAADDGPILTGTEALAHFRAGR